MRLKPSHRRSSQSGELQIACIQQHIASLQQVCVMPLIGRFTMNWLKGRTLFVNICENSTLTMYCALTEQAGWLDREVSGLKHVTTHLLLTTSLSRTITTHAVPVDSSILNC